MMLRPLLGDTDMSAPPGSSRLLVPYFIATPSQLIATVSCWNSHLHLQQYCYRTVMTSIVTLPTSMSLYHTQFSHHKPKFITLVSLSRIFKTPYSKTQRKKCHDSNTIISHSSSTRTRCSISVSINLSSIQRDNTLRYV